MQMHTINYFKHIIKALKSHCIFYLQSTFLPSASAEPAFGKAEQYLRRLSPFPGSLRSEDDGDQSMFLSVHRRFAGSHEAVARLGGGTGLEACGPWHIEDERIGVRRSVVQRRHVGILQRCYIRYIRIMLKNI